MNFQNEIYDNVVPLDLRKEVWDYLQTREYFAVRKLPKSLKNGNTKLIKGEVIYYTPADKKYEYLDKTVPGYSCQYMHRTLFGQNEADLVNHEPILKLWNCINQHLGNQYVIDGDPEGVPTVDKNTGWSEARSYVNVQPNEDIKRTHGVHRDSVDMNADDKFTLLYFANLNWYPSWGAENVFYSEDNTTGDHQQFQIGLGQVRGFNIGWPFKYVDPRPGRVLLYDGRSLHTTKPATLAAQEMRYAVAFRIRKINAGTQQPTE